MRHLISINDIPRSQLEQLFRRTDEFREEPIQSLLLENRTIAMLFQKPSTRTRMSFEVAMTHLGGHAIFMGWQESQLGRGESIADTVKTLERYVDGIVARLDDHQDLLEMTKHSNIPVINGLTDLLHPCQALADMYTIDDKLGRLKGIKLAYFGDGSSNVCHSLIYACSKMGINMSIACPREYVPNQEILDNARGNCKLTGAKIKIMGDPKRAAEGADVLYTDTWVSMGEEMERRERMRIIKPYQLSQPLLKLASMPRIVMHSLPAYRGQEIAANVIDGPFSVVWDQAENRMHMQKAILAMLLEKHTF